MFSIESLVMWGIICKGLHRGQVGDVDLHEMWTGKTKAPPTQTSPLKEKQQWHNSLSPQRTCLSRCIETCQPNSCQRKQCPAEGQLYIIFMSCAETWNDMKALWFHTSINIVCGKLANKPGRHCKVIISLKSDYLPTGNSCMLLAFRSHPCLQLLMMHFDGPQQDQVVRSVWQTTFPIERLDRWWLDEDVVIWVSID